MEKLKAIIADDEAPLRSFLKTVLQDVWPDLHICGEAENGPQALSLIEKHDPDFAFLDIKMPGMSGIEVAGKVAGICRVVFITAHEDYAVEAFEHEAVDYILKPVTLNRLKKMITRLQKSLSRPERSSEDISKLFERLEAAVKPLGPRQYLQWIKVQHDEGVRLISVNDVLYFQADANHTKVVSKSDVSFIRMTIRELTDQLDPQKFWRIHKATIVNVMQIQETARSLTGRFQIKLKDRPETLTVSRTYDHLFREM